MKDCYGQEIIPIQGRRLSVHTNKHPNTDGTYWGWVEGCTVNILWSNSDDKFTKSDAVAFVDEYNKSVQPTEKSS